MPENKDQQNGGTGEGDPPAQTKTEEIDPPKHVLINLNEDAEFTEIRNDDEDS